MDLDVDVWKVRLFSSISNLSRTSAGSANRAYAEKPPLLITDPIQLQRQTNQNLTRAIEYVWDQGPFVELDDRNVRVFIDCLAEKVSDKLMTPENRLRTWDLDEKIYPRACAPEALEKEYPEFCEGVVQLLNTDTSAVRRAARIEREFDSELHPLPDGCGRVAKLLGAWMLLRGKKYSAHFDDRTEYYAAMKSPQRAWEKFYRSHVPS